MNNIKSALSLAGMILAQSVMGSSVIESERKIPVAYDVDVVVIGGSSTGVAAAVEAAKRGKKVFLSARRPYLGNNLCGTGFSWLEPGEVSDHPLVQSIYFSEGEKYNQKTTEGVYRTPTPLKIKTELDKVLIGAGVEFLYGSFATDILADKDGQPSGIVMANRSGRQAVKAKVIVDATDRAWFARSIGAQFTEYPSSRQSFKRIVIGGKPNDGAKKLPFMCQYTLGSKDRPKDIYRYEFTIKSDGSYESLTAVDQKARTKTWQNGQAWGSEVLYQVPPDFLKSKGADTGVFTGVDSLKISAFKPASVNNILVASPSADVLRGTASALMRPHTSFELGQWIGAEAATMADSRGRPESVTVCGSKVNGNELGEVKEFLNGVRGELKTATVFVDSKDRDLKVLGRFDTVVIGGGTAGAPAGIASARSGAKTLVVEFHHGLGGVSTMGVIGKYWYGNRVGFTKEYDNGTGNNLF